MSIIGIDASMVLHGERAGLRNTRNLLNALLGLDTDDRWRLLYLDRKGSSPGKIGLPDNGRCLDHVARWPIRFLIPAWRLFRIPTVENWLGKVDVLYAPDLYFPPARQAPVLCTVRGVAYLAIPHLCEPEKVRGLTTAFAYARKHAQHFLAVSESTRRDLLRLTDIPPERIHVVTHGVDPDFKLLDKQACRRRVSQRFGIQQPFLLYVGVIGRHKNVMGLLHAFSVANLAKQGVALVMAGPFEPQIKPAMAFVEKQRLSGAVHFLGPIGQQDSTLVELYNAALGLVHPTFYEGWCATPLEAMACGTPVMAADIPSVREVVGEAAVLSAPNDTDAWATGLLKIVESEDLRLTLSAKGLSHVRQHSWERAAERLHQLLTDIQVVGR